MREKIRSKSAWQNRINIIKYIQSKDYDII